MNEKRERSDLAIIITRLSAHRGYPDDEFIQDWDSSGQADHIALNSSGSEGPSALIIHGHNKLLSMLSPNTLAEVVATELEKAGIDHRRFTHLWLCVHGSLPDGYRLSESTTADILGTVAKGKVFIPKPYSSEGNPSASLALLKALESEQNPAPDDLLGLIAAGLKLRPAVETIARSMQDLFLELRLWLELLRKDATRYSQFQQRLTEIATALEDRYHLNAPPMRKALKYLFHLLTENSQLSLGTLTYEIRADFVSDLDKEIIASMPEHAGDQDIQLLDIEGKLLEPEGLCKITDADIRFLAARLEAVIECAARVDSGEIRCEQ